MNQVISQTLGWVREINEQGVGRTINSKQVITSLAVLCSRFILTLGGRAV